MDIKWDTPLRDGQKDHPVVYSELVDLPKDVFFPDDLSLKLIFKTDGYKLQTWGRSKDSDGKTILTNDPHWIAVRKSTPLHFDPKYPRYSHHLKIRVDDGIYVRGKAKKELKWTPKTSLNDLVKEMIDSDLKNALKEKTLREKGLL